MIEIFYRNLNLGWIKIYEDISIKLLDYEGNRGALIKMIESYDSLIITEEKDPEKKRMGVLDDICPFTVINLLNRGLIPSSRNEMLEHYSKFFKVDIGDFTYSPTNERWRDAIPVADAQSRWFFEHIHKRGPDDIDKLWNIFKDCLDYADKGNKDREKFISNYDTAVNIDQIRTPKFSKILYTLRPYSFPSLNNNNVDYLRNLIENKTLDRVSSLPITSSKGNYTGEEYLDITDTLKKELSSRYIQKGGKNYVFIGLASDTFRYAYEHKRDKSSPKSMIKGCNKELNLGWIPIYEKISKKLLKKSSKLGRKELVEMLYNFLDNNKQLGLSRLADQDPEGNSIDLDDICPLTVMNFLNRWLTADKKDKILAHYLNFFKLPPTSFRFAEDNSKETIPLADNMNFWFFPHKFERKDDDIKRQWEMLQAAIDYADGKRKNEEKFINAYDSSVKVKQVGRRKLSGALYALRPRAFPTLDDNVCTYLYNLSKKGELKSKILNDLFSKRTGSYDGAQYLSITNALVEEFSGKFGKKDVFIGLSCDAYHNGTCSESITAHPLNQILYGPPGTGKTYKTAQFAVEIITGESREDRSENEGERTKNREALLKEYHDYIKNGHIHFVTFHQSYGYEEFVEGIKPKIRETDNSRSESSGNSDIEYEIKPGIFREICAAAQEAQSPSASENAWAVRLWIGPEMTEEREFKQECIDGNYIAIRETRKTDAEEKTRGLQEFQENCKAGDLIIVPAYSTGKDWNIVAVGKLKKRREYSDPSKPGILLWDVQWLWYDLDEPKKLDKYRQGDSTKTRLASGVIIEPVEDIDTKALLQDIANDKPPYVLIIDEINRGNISKILGELITLLEADKRLGEPEELKVTLPYSDDEFGVPNNLYIIGTMNTADRSIAFFDTALRRRFTFEEIMPRPELLTQKIGDVELDKLLIAMNKEIKELLGRDYQIGHSYLMPHKVSKKEELARVFRNSICPLLDEYFYDNRGEIATVLNESPLFPPTDGGDRNREWASKKEFENLDYYKKIYENK